VPTQYSDEVWSGLEYPLAGLLLFHDELDIATKILADIRERHNGTRRSPWNEVECGDHYVRPLASWILLEAASGYYYDAVQEQLRFAPRFNPNKFRSFFITGSGWGSFSQQQDSIQLSLDYGSLSLNKLQLATQADKAMVSLGSKKLEATMDQIEGMLTLQFDQPIMITVGEMLQVKFS
jgi:hypothetical protein